MKCAVVKIQGFQEPENHNMSYTWNINKKYEIFIK